MHNIYNITNYYIYYLLLHKHAVLPIQYGSIYNKDIMVYTRGGQLEETREPSNILRNMKEPKCKKKKVHII